MNILINTKLALTRMLGPNIWNQVLLRNGFHKFSRQQPELANLIKANLKYEKIHHGERCFVIGNGPSLNSQDLAKLKDEYVFTCNQIMRNPIFPQLCSNYHFWADPSCFITNPYKPEDIELLNVMKSVNTSNNKPINFFPQEGFEFVKNTNLKNELHIDFYAHRLELTEKSKIEIDFSRFVPNFFTVVHYAIAMATYMGFREIILLGCDCTNVLTAVNTRLTAGDGAEYAYHISENDKKRMINRNQTISFEDELCSFYHVFRGYRILNKICAQRKIKLINCTKGGILDCVTRLPYEKII